MPDWLGTWAKGNEGPSYNPGAEQGCSRLARRLGWHRKSRAFPSMIKFRQHRNRNRLSRVLNRRPWVVWC